MAALKLGWIGTGVMGKSMVEHLMNAGYNLSIYTRTLSKAQPLLDKGAEFKSPAEIAASCDVVFTMLGYPKDVEEVVLGESGLLKHMQPGSLLIDHTSSCPNLAVRIHREALTKGVHSLDAPVTGGDVGARNGTLTIFVGGEEEQFTRASEIMKHYGQNIQHMGEAGTGQRTKLTNQIILAGNMIGMVEGIMYSYRAGLPVAKVVELISTGAAGSASLRVLGPRILKGDLEPGFYIEHYVKDMELALDEARRMNLCLPGLSMVHQFYKALVANGAGRKGTQGLILALEMLNNTKISPQA
jgi:3-hydroxyisobutyrate dehydrogenase